MGAPENETRLWSLAFLDGEVKISIPQTMDHHEVDHFKDVFAEIIRQARRNAMPRGDK